MSEMSVVWEPVHPKIDGSVFGLVSDLLLNEEIDHRDHFGDVFRVGSGGIEVSVFNPQGTLVLEERGRKFFGELGQRNIGGPAVPYRFIVDVRDIHHPSNGVPPRFEMPLQQVFEQVRAEVCPYGRTNKPSARRYTT